LTVEERALMSLRTKPLRLLLLACIFSAQALAAGAKNTEEHFIKVDGVERRYLLHLPPGWTKQSKAPVIFMLHGGGGTPEHSGGVDLEKYGDPKGFIIVYPEGKNRAWNDGREIKGRTADDVAFLSALMDELVATYNADGRRIYATGISNGGFMSFTLACRIPEKIAAIAPVAASMGPRVMEDCRPSRSIPVMMINGTADPLVKFEGGHVLRRQGDEAEPIGTVVEFWRHQACGSAKPPIRFERLPDVDPNDGSTVEVERIHCPGGEIVNYTVRGGGHTWPGGTQYLPKFIVGNVNHDFSASQAIVEFFGSK
jgi:polyhydroxybutyrate depolymerase